MIEFPLPPLFAAEHTQWLVYWQMFALFSQLDLLVCANFDALLPLYVPLKTLFLLYLALPQTYGAHNLYVNYLSPMLQKRRAN